MVDHQKRSQPITTQGQSQRCKQAQKIQAENLVTIIVF
jgi:hypothetical protein